VGQTPVVEVTGERKSVNMISAVSPGGTLHFDVFFGSCNATVFVEFLKKFMHDAPGPVYLILDNVSWVFEVSRAGLVAMPFGRWRSVTGGVG
jgi:DDE superfamily endonuclease